MTTPALPSTRLILVRHAQAGGRGQPYGPDAPLTDAGRRQADLLAAALAEDDIATVFSSPYRRAQDTAEPLRRRLGRSLDTDERLAEFRVSPDDRRTIEEIVDELRHLMLWRPHDQDGPGGETLAQFQQRVSAFMDEAARRSAPGAAVIVAHAGTIAAAMRWAYGLTPQHDWHSDVEVYNASITEIRYWPQGRHPEGAPYAAAIRRLNDVRHLPPDLVTQF